MTTIHRLRLLGLLLCVGCTGPAKVETDSGAVSVDDSAGGGDSDDPQDSHSADDSDDDSDDPQDSHAADDSDDPQDTSPEVTEETADPELIWAEPCVTQAEPVQTGAIVETTLDEVSGIAVSMRDPFVLWVHEDHAGDSAIYALDSDGNTLATVTLDGATNNDWEDIAIGPCGDEICIFIAEIGNNDLDREDLGVYVLPEPDLADIEDGALTTADWRYYGFDYPDGAENAEALVVTTDGLPMVLSKHFEDERSNVYIFPALDDSADVVLTLLGTIVTGAEGDNMGAALTAASLWPDDSRLIFRTYLSVYELDLAGGIEGVETAPETKLVGAAETGGEAITYDPWRGGFWQVAEGAGSAIWYVGCGEAE